MRDNGFQVNMRQELNQSSNHWKERAALHEAGHTFINIFFDIPFQYIQIAPIKDSVVWNGMIRLGEAGSFDNRIQRNESEWDKYRITAEHIMSDVAGNISEWVKYNEEDKLIEFIDIYSNPEARVNNYYQYLITLGQVAFRNSISEEEIHKFRKYYFEFMRGYRHALSVHDNNHDDAWPFFLWSLLQAKSLIINKWLDIVCIAEVLLERERMEYYECIQLIST